MPSHLVALALLLASCASGAEAGRKDELAAFPAADPGMVRHVIRLPPHDQEDGFKVELIVGKTITTRDAVNHMWLAGTLKAEEIPGWGYTRYVMSAIGPDGGSTLMGFPENSPEIRRFIQVGGEYLVRYNSRLPLVVYTPVDSEVRYRIWSAQPEAVKAPRE